MRLRSLSILTCTFIVGLALGDSALFKAFALIGPRRGMMAMVTAPVFTVVVAWLALDERLGPLALAGIVVVIAGVLLAVAGRDPGGGRKNWQGCGQVRHACEGAGTAGL